MEETTKKSKLNEVGNRVEKKVCFQENPQVFEIPANKKDVCDSGAIGVGGPSSSDGYTDDDITLIRKRKRILASGIQKLGYSISDIEMNEVDSLRSAHAAAEADPEIITDEFGITFEPFNMLAELKEGALDSENCFNFKSKSPDIVTDPWLDSVDQKDCRSVFKDDNERSLLMKKIDEDRQKATYVTVDIQSNLRALVSLLAPKETPTGALKRIRVQAQSRGFPPKQAKSSKSRRGQKSSVQTAGEGKEEEVVCVGEVTPGGFDNSCSNAETLNNKNLSDEEISEDDEAVLIKRDPEIHAAVVDKDHRTLNGGSDCKDIASIIKPSDFPLTAATPSSVTTSETGTASEPTETFPSPAEAASAATTTPPAATTTTPAATTTTPAAETTTPAAATTKPSCCGELNESTHELKASGRPKVLVKGRMNAKEKETFDKLIDLCSGLVAVGKNVYYNTKEEIEKMIDDLDHQTSVPESIPDNPTNEDILYQFRWSNNPGDSDVHGPFTAAQFREWIDQGFISEKNPVELRRVTADNEPLDGVYLHYKEIDFSDPTFDEINDLQEIDE